MSLNLLSKNLTDINPELESLRAKALEENSIQTDDWIFQIIEKTSRLHAGFLFEDQKTLQNLCLYVCETQNGFMSAGWKALGSHLGLSSSIIKVINNNNFTKEDPCYNILLAYVQHDNASIGKIIEALYLMGRIDILSRIQEPINNLVDTIINSEISTVINNKLIGKTGDPKSEPSLQDCETNNGNVENKGNLIKPKVIPAAPFIFKNIEDVSEQTHLEFNYILSLNPIGIIEKKSCNNSLNKISSFDYTNKDFKIKFLREIFKGSRCASSDKKNNGLPKQKYGLKILLTFAEDGEQYVNKICKSFRKKRENFPSIGVLVLSEHSEKVNEDPLQFISGSFHQVDYVCPILTAGYFNLITKKQIASSLSNMQIDSAYAPYIYRLMNSYFVSNDCLNDKVRCIIPEKELSLLAHNFWLKNPLFGAWIKLNEIEDFAIRLLKSIKK